MNCWDLTLLIGSEFHMPSTLVLKLPGWDFFTTGWELSQFGHHGNMFRKPCHKLSKIPTQKPVLLLIAQKFTLKCQHHLEASLQLIHPTKITILLKGSLGFHLLDIQHLYPSYILGGPVISKLQKIVEFLTCLSQEIMSWLIEGLTLRMICLVELD